MNITRLNSSGDIIIKKGSGGGNSGGGGSSSDNWEYWDTKGMQANEVATAFSVLACLVKLPSYIGPAWQASRVADDTPCYMVAIDKSLPLIMGELQITTVGEYLSMDIGGGMTLRDVFLSSGFTQTTKEAFYDINL